MPLQYITRGQVTPQGKPRVYFCCHPSEHKQLLDIISREILEKQNCALWHLENPNQVRDADFWDELKQMQLLVMPVTTKLLTTDNPAMAEFHFAIENHIPVLPLMQEHGLESLFNQKCGSLQFLDPNIKDSTAISYSEKLTRFLAAVLVSDELAQKIRSAFDAYVFLSYRKKDRRHAQELMRMIHQNDFCRDIAIWYDEFLTPGEDFNDAIKAALEKSNLFTLAVTPNLVIEDNYIQKHEYPMAKDIGKPILPVEMQPTNRAELEKLYKNIPACTSGYDPVSLTNGLLEHLRQIALLENSNDPTHNYLIGLAYLNGIDVEVDHPRAVELITGAAESGLAEAAGQLVEMYRTGLAVTRDFHTAIQWQKKKVSLLEAQYAANPSEQNLHILFWETLYCGDYLRDLGQITQALSTYETATQKAEDNQHISRRMKRALGAGFARLGHLCLINDDLPAARAFQENACRIAKELANDWNSPGDRIDIAISLRELGSVYEAQGDLDGAIAKYQEALAIDDDMASKVDFPDAQRGVSHSCEQLGNIYFTQLNFEKAKSFYFRSLDILDHLFQQDNTANIRRSILVCHNMLGRIYEDEQNFTEARIHYEKAMDHGKVLVAETGTSDACRCLAIAYFSIGALCLQEENLSEAETFCKQGLEQIILLAKDINTVDTRRDLANAYDRMGNVYLQQGKQEAAKDLFEKQIALDEALAAETGTIRCRQSLAISCRKIGKIALAENDLSAANDYYQRSLSILESLREESRSLEIQQDLSATYRALGNLSEVGDDLKTAEKYYLQGLIIDEALAEETGSALVRRDLSLSYEKMGVVCRSQKKKFEATKYFKQSLAIRQELVRETGTAQAREDCALAHCFLATQSIFHKRKHFREARKIIQELLTEMPDNSRLLSTLEKIETYL